MNKRIRKKIYKKHIVDIAIDITLEASWRKKIFDGEYNKTFDIDCKAVISTLTEKALRRYSLIYQVCKIPLSEEGERIAREYNNPCTVTFKFQSKEFPDIFYYTLNNPHSI